MKSRKSNREQFWEYLKVGLLGFDKTEIVTVLGDLNMKVANRNRGDVIVELCEKRDTIIGSTWFENMINKYT